MYEDLPVALVIKYYTMWSVA